MFRYSDKGECADKDVLSFAIASEIAAGRGTEHGGVAFDASGVGRERLEEAYSAYVKRYRAVGMDIAEQAMEIAPAAHTSLGGVYARPDCSTSVEGLFVCGETSADCTARTASAAMPDWKRWCSAAERAAARRRIWTHSAANRRTARTR